MQTIWPLIEEHVARNWEAYTALASALCIAGVCTMPEYIPGIRHDHAVQEWWAWLRNTLQTAIPAARAAHTNRPTLPADTPANPKP